MSKIIKVTLEYDDKIDVMEGSDAVEWLKNANSLAVFAEIHNCNPFKHSPAKFTTTIKDLNQSPPGASTPYKP